MFMEDAGGTMSTESDDVSESWKPAEPVYKWHKIYKFYVKSTSGERLFFQHVYYKAKRYNGKVEVVEIQSSAERMIDKLKGDTDAIKKVI